MRRVTGSIAPAFSSMMPNRAGNFASGGASSVAVASGKLAAFASCRPASSLRPAGSSTRNVVRSGSGAGNETAST
ncbi:MAG TPA: hypothetical protein VML91_10320 [Burkholderiales bacterium]|nr:hypothetical protein [Burkholderiales bacterium]